VQSSQGLVAQGRRRCVVYRRAVRRSAKLASCAAAALRAACVSATGRRLEETAPCCTLFANTATSQEPSVTPASPSVSEGPAR
jgi:hypothetical protein